MGDSRAYLLRDGGLEGITRDHTVVQELVESGALTLSAAGAYPLSHLRNRAVSTSGAVEPDVFDGSARAGDILMLCTDGLVGLVTDSELQDALQGLSSDGLEDATAGLVAEAHARGAPDNVTLGFLAFEEASSPGG